MFATIAHAQATAGAPAGGGGMQDMLLQFSIIPVMFVLLYFLMIRPQQQRAKKHQEQVAAVKRGDTVVLTSGVIGTVSRVDDSELTVEVSPKVEIKVVKAMVHDIRSRGAPVAANDLKK